MDNRLLYCFRELTPARTRVMSRTLIPARGRLRPSPPVAVARLLRGVIRDQLRLLCCTAILKPLLELLLNNDAILNLICDKSGGNNRERLS
jgi:hypothetical protein